MTVTVEEDIRCGQWEIEEANFPYSKEDVTRVLFHLPVKAKEKTTLRYTLLCTW